MTSFTRLCFCFFFVFLTQNTPINCHLWWPWQRHSRFLEPLRGRLSAEPEAWGAVRTVGLADHVTVWTTRFRWRLRVQASGPGGGRHRHAFLLKETLLCIDDIVSPPPQKRWRLTCLGPGCLEACRPRKRCPRSSCVPRRTPPRAAPASWCAGRDGTRTPLSPPCRCWRDASRCESAAGGQRAESRLGSRWRSERVSRPRWISWTWGE